MLRDTDIAYAAGLLDGEGSIVIGLSKRKRLKGIVPDHWLQVGITGTNREMLDWLRQNFGGHISDSSHSKSRKKQRPCWTWRVMSNQASEFLKLLLPFLKDKHQRAILAIEFQETKTQTRATGGVLSQEAIDKRQWYKDKISSLNLGWRTIPD